jgi:predicted DsbA family dithiol-disulfide isomerase
VRWRAFPLHPETPEAGVSLESFFAGRDVDIEATAQRLKKAAADAGLPFNGTRMLYNTRLAQELSLWAESGNAGDGIHSAIFRAYFVDGRNIASVPVLADLAASVGLSREEARKVLEARSFRAAVDADWQRSVDLRIRAVPTFILNQERLVGAQPYEDLVKLLESNGVKRR